MATIQIAPNTKKVTAMVTLPHVLTILGQSREAARADFGTQIQTDPLVVSQFALGLGKGGS